MSEDQNRVTFVLTGPREGFTGVLGGRYGFRNGKLTVDQHMRAPLRNVLCTRYCCNIEGEPPLWKTVKSDKGKSSKQVTALDIRTESDNVTTVVEAPKAKVEVPSPPKPAEGAPKDEGKKGD